VLSALQSFFQKKKTKKVKMVTIKVRHGKWDNVAVRNILPEDSDDDFNYKQLVSELCRRVDCEFRDKFYLVAKRKFYFFVLIHLLCRDRS
jgi:hypothetical protein